MEYEIIGGVAIAPIIVFLVQRVKAMFPDFDVQRFGAALAVGFGVVIALGYAVAQMTLSIPALIEAIGGGALIGLAASGLYSGVHSAQQAQKAERIIIPEATIGPDADGADG